MGFSLLLQIYIIQILKKSMDYDWTFNEKIGFKRSGRKLVNNNRRQFIFNDHPLKWISFSKTDICHASMTRLCWPFRSLVILSIIGADAFFDDAIRIEVYPIDKPFASCPCEKVSIYLIWVSGYSASPSEMKTKMLFLSLWFSSISLLQQKLGQRLFHLQKKQMHFYWNSQELSQ